MQAKKWVMLRVLLNRYHPGAAQGFLKGIPQQNMQAILGLDIDSQEPAAAFISPEDKIKKIHYSWLYPSLKKMPMELQPLILKLLPQHHAARLSKLLNVAIPAVEPAGSGKNFLLNLFSQQIPDEEVLPIAYLPPTPFTPLLSFSKHDLVELIDLLGIFDLGEEIRYVVDKNTLKNLYGCLGPKKQQFLRICLHQKEKVIAPRLKLEKWHGACDQLLLQLHQRGLVRLSKALCGQNPSFMWHLTHTLDSGRGKIISKNFKTEEIPGITRALTLQVINTINFLTKKSSS
jgi:hypothetical protein